MLIDSLLLLLNFTDFLQPIQLIALFSMAIVAVHLVTPPPLDDWEVEQPKTLYRYLHASWLGHLNLAQAFWPFFILLNATLFYIDYRANNGIYTIASWRTTHVILAMPVIAWTGAVWRSSEKCSARYWAVAARFLTVAAYFDFALRWIISERYPEILFTCDTILIQLHECFF